MVETRVSAVHVRCRSVGWAAALGAVALAAPGVRAQCEASWATHLPTSRTETDAVYDSQRQRTVLFGGIDGATLKGDTWESDGAGWRLVATAGPSPRRGHKMVYDAAHRRTLLVGGFTGSASPIETWAWDGGTWRLLDAAGPSFTFTTAAAQEAALALDPLRARLVLVLASGQTWERSTAGDAWELVATTGPSARRGMAMAYDRTRARVLLVGGLAGSTRLNDTWAWDGSQWAPVAAPGLPARSEARMVFDAAGRRTLLFGGLGATGARLRDLWALSASGWAQLGGAAPATPATGTTPAMAFDSARRQILLIGGSVAPWADLCQADVGAAAPAWSQAVFGPTARAGAASAYDEARGRAVVFGGLGTARLGDTWEFDGSAWRQVPISGPSARSEAAMAFDPVRRRTVLFGGNTGLVNDETWEYDGAAWTRVFVTGPSARERHAMAYDPGLRAIVLHGGAVSGGASSNETWTYNGVAWTRLGTGPTRAGHAMAYFPTLGRTVLYGGSGAGVSQTAFALSGSTWAALGAPGPGPAVEATLTYIPGSSALMLVGASGSDAAAWSFDGAAWRRSPNAAGTARARTNHSAWFDAVRGDLVTFGGTAGSSAIRETWELRSVTGPVVDSAPVWQSVCRGGSAVFSVRLNMNSTADGAVWLKDGVPVASGRSKSGASVATEVSADAKVFTLSVSGAGDGDAGLYQCLLTSACGGATITGAARLSVCVADFNCSGTGAGDGVTQQDIFDFMTAFFASDPRADINGNGEVTVQDLFDFISAYFTGC